MEGAIPCRDCGAPITTWRGSGTGTRFDADPYDPYRLHVCDGRDRQIATLGRRVGEMVEQVERLAGILADRSTRRTPVPVSGPFGQMTVPARAVVLPVPPATPPASALHEDLDD